MSMGGLFSGILVALLTSAVMAGGAQALPIVSAPPLPSLPDFSGGAVKAEPIKTATGSPQNPFMADSPFSNIHNDAWMSDAYDVPGPLGRNLTTSSGAAQAGICSSILFDSQGRILTVCSSTVAAPQARLVDPDTLEVLATYNLPNAPALPDSKPYQNFAGGGYFYLDNLGRIVVATKTDHLFILAVDPATSQFELVRDFDLTSVLDPATDRISSALPDYKGRIWFVGKQTGKIGVLDKKTGRIKAIELGQSIQNSFAVGKDGIYVATDRAMYRFGLTKGGVPKTEWKKKYANSGIVKPGQAEAGTGTTPTIMKGGYVAITDNADPMNVVVYRTAKKLKGKSRVVCQVPVFRKGKSATENSLIGTGRSLLVENNYGYTDIFADGADQVVTEPGFARVDIRKDGKGCRKVWTSYAERAPSVVSKLSTKTGLIYTYTRPPEPSGSQGYYWTAIRFKNGKTAWSKYSGSGFVFNNNYSGMALGPNKRAYLGVAGGIISLRDN